jgi:uncharacterized protein (TIGR02444 family)
LAKFNMTEPPTTAPSPGSPFWQFSLGFYRVPEVAAACVRLQDEADVDVNLLFFLLWNASQHRQLSPAVVEEADRRISDWRQTVIVPLRALRRALKVSPGLIEPAASEIFRTKVQALELESERLQQEALYDLARLKLLGEPAASADEAARSNIGAYERSTTRRFPKAPVDVLLAAFAKLPRA